MFKNTAIVTLFMILSSVLGFLAQIVYVSSFGATSEMDIYFTILSVPTIITGMAPIVFTSVLLPCFAKFKSNVFELNQFIHSLWSYIILFSLLFILVGCTISICNINLFIANFPSYYKSTAIEVSLMIWSGSGLFIASSFLGAVLNYDKKFVKVAWTAILPALLMIIMVLIFHKYIGIRSISLGLLLANLLQFIIFIVALFKTFPVFRLTFRGVLNFKQLLTQTLFVVLSLLPFTIFIPIGYYWASFLDKGSVSYLGYSQSFAGFLSVATGMGIAIVSFPDLANDFANGVGKAALMKFEVTLRYVMLISIFAAAAFIALRIPIISIFYEHGSFTHESVVKLSGVIPWYLGAAVFIAALNLLRTLFYSRGEFKKIAILGVLIPILYFITAGLLKNIFSIVGIGIANSFSLALMFYSSLILAKANEKSFLTVKFHVFMLKNTITAIIVCLITTYCYNLTTNFTSQIPAIIICLLLFSTIYFLMSKYIMDLSEIRVIEKMTIDKFKARIQK